MQSSPFGTIAGAYKLVELQLENKEDTSKNVFKRQISQIQHVNVPLLRSRRPTIRNQFQNYQAQTVSILKKKSTALGLNRSVQTKKSVRFSSLPKNNSKDDEQTPPPPDKITPSGRTVSNPERRTLIPKNVKVLNNSMMSNQENPYVNSKVPTLAKSTLLSRTFSSSNPSRQRILNSLEFNKENLNPYISKENVVPNKTHYSRTFSSSSSRQTRVLNSLEFNVMNNSQFKKRKLEKNCSMEMTLKSLKQIFM